MRRLCALYGVSRSGYYAWKNRPPSPHQQYDAHLKAVIAELHQGYYRAYGAPRVHRLLRQKGVVCSRRRVNRLMRELGIEASTTGCTSGNPGNMPFTPPRAINCATVMSQRSRDNSGPVTSPT